MIKYLLAWFILLPVLQVNGQSIIPRFETLGVNDGLPHSSVYSILQDKKGFMWFGTADGLCRYDGTELQTFKYKPLQKKEVVNHFVKGKILEDPMGNIWFCTLSGIYKWDVIKEAVICARSFEDDYRVAEFQMVTMDERNLIWMFSITQGIVSYNIKTGVIANYQFPFKINFASILYSSCKSDDRGNIWLRIGGSVNGFIVFNRQSAKYTIRFKEDTPDAIFFDKGREVLAYNNKLLYYNAGDSIAVTVPKRMNGKAISFYSFDGLSDNYGRLWMTARGNGLFYYDERRKIFKTFHHDNSKIKSLPFDLTTCLYIDRNENLWIGIDGGGVAKLDLKAPKFNLFPLSEGDFPVLKDYFTKCFYVDKTGRIWFGTQTNGLNIFDPEKSLLVNYHHNENNDKSLPGDMVGSIFRDKDNNTWIGSSGGFSFFNEQRASFTNIPVQNLPKLFPLLNNFVYKIIQLKSGNLLAATILGIIQFEKDGNGAFKGSYFPGNRYMISTTTDVVEMPGDTIYATVTGVGLYQFKKEGKSYRFLRSFFPGTDLRSVRKDEHAAGFLWIGSGKGLIHFNTKNYKSRTWDEEDGMANNYVYGSLEDTSGNLWISTNKGLIFFNRLKESFENYSYQDGLQSNEFNTQALYKSDNGDFYFGGIRGFNWFRPGYKGKGDVKPVAAITKIENNDLPYIKDENYARHNLIEVPYNKNNFNFQFAALDYTRPEANKVQYMLEGWEAKQVTSLVKTVRYVNLPPGKYTLHLKVANAAGAWSDEETLHIFIQPPFWQRTWFLSLLVLALILIVAVAAYSFAHQKAKRKLQVLEKQIAVNAERNRISADMHDEIGSGITQIALLSELIQSQQKESPELKKDIHVIATSARKLVQTMSEIIWALNPQNDTLENLLAYMREQSYQYFELMDVQFKIDFPEAVPDVKLTNAERRNIYLVAREALNNAMKHSGASTIKLKMEMEGDVCCFTVTDDGKGISSEKIRPGSNGMGNMKKRMVDINGSINWLCDGNGTHVNFCLPIHIL